MPEEPTQQPEALPFAASPEARPPSPTESLSGLFGIIQAAVGLILGLGAFLSVAGFIIVNYHLSLFTDIQGYSVDSKQYVAAGIGWLFFLIIGKLLVDLVQSALKIKSVTSVFYLSIIISIVLIALVVVFALPQIKQGVAFPDSRLIIWALLPAALVFPYYALIGIEEIFKVSYTEVLHNPISVNSMYLGVVLIIYAVLGGLYFSATAFALIPHYLGGGQPASIILVFKDDDTLTRLGIAQDPVHPTRTQNIMLLADLTDGMLVLDPSSGQVLAIKNDSILGVYDDKVNAPYLATATPTFTPTLSPTPTDKPTPAATITATP